MANKFTNFLYEAVTASGNLRDYQHANRLYVSNFYELAPKAGWIYYVSLNLNPEMRQAVEPAYRKEFDQWFSRQKGAVGMLAKSVDLPKFSVQTETLNQYNRKTVIQKQITYNPISITFHDDMANATTMLWKSYYQYYFADSIVTGQGKTTTPPAIIPKFTDYKYKDYNTDAEGFYYGLNNKQTVPYFLSIDVYQLYKKTFTSFRIINPLIKDWAHDQLDQTQGNRLLTSKMTLEYETVIYNTNPTALEKGSLREEIKNNHYDTTPSPLSIGGVGTNSIFGPGGIVAGASDVFGDLQNINEASPLDLMNTAIKGANLARNARNINAAGVKEEGYNILTGTLGKISSAPATVLNTDGTITQVPSADRTGQLIAKTTQGISQTISGVKSVINPVGINLFTGNNTSINGQVQAQQKKL